MKEIVNRLHENRQIETAKSILESAGYKVTKKSKRLKESKESTSLVTFLRTKGFDYNQNEKDLQPLIDTDGYESVEYFFDMYDLAAELLKVSRDNIVILADEDKFDSYTYIEDGDEIRGLRAVQATLESEYESTDDTSEGYLYAELFEKDADKVVCITTMDGYMMYGTSK